MKKIFILAVFAIIVAAPFVFIDRFSNRVKNALSLEEAKAVAEKFINDNLMNPGNKATVSSIGEDNGIYKLTVEAGGQQIISYLSKDGKFFFPQALDIKEIESSVQNASAPVSAEVKTKSAKPAVELFVMSYCPYGTQIEKGILPVVKLLGDKIDFKLKFVDYAMHEKKEIDENTLQYCLETKQGSKFLPYLECFLKAGDSKSCLAETGVNESELNSCLSETDKRYKITELYKDSSKWSGSYPPFNVYLEDNEKYGVGGSPTLIINGETVSPARDSASLLATVCSAFGNKPDECYAELSSAAPSSGFGSGGPSTSGSCN